MKLRWLILGTIAAVTGGVFIAKHFLNRKEFIAKDNDKKINNIQNSTFEPDFEYSEFLN